MVHKIQEMEDYDVYDPVPYQGGYDIGVKYGALKPADGKYRSGFGLEPPVAQYGNEQNPYARGHPGPPVCPGCWKPGAVYGGGRDRTQLSKDEAQPDNLARTSPKGRVKPSSDGRAKPTSNGKSMLSWICRWRLRSKGRVKPISNGDAKPRCNGDGKPSSNGDAKLSSNGDAKLSSNGDAKLSSNGDAKLSSNGDAKPSSNGDGKPRSIGDAKLSSNGDAKPSSNGNGKPSSNGDAKPSSDGKAMPEEEHLEPRAIHEYKLSEESGYHKLASTYDEEQRSKPGFYAYSEAVSAYRQPYYGYEEAYRPTYSEVDQYGYRNPFFGYGNPFYGYDDAGPQPGDSSVYQKPYNEEEEESKARPTYVEQTTACGGEEGAHNYYGHGYGYQPNYYGEEASGYGGYGGYGGQHFKQFADDDPARFGGGSTYIEEPIQHALPPASNRPFISWW